MNEAPNIWLNRQQQFDKLFPAITGLLVVAIGSFAFLISKTGASSEVTATTPSSNPAVEQQIQALEAGVVAGAATSNGLINLKVATVTDLDKLKGIGPKKAEQIVALRNEGKISSVTDLQKVKGIGPKLYADIKDQLVWE